MISDGSLQSYTIGPEIYMLKSTSVFTFRHEVYGLHVGIFGWILVMGTFVLCDVFLVLHNVTADTCVSINQWVENPTYHTALDDILPCVDNATGLETSMKSREVTSQLVNVINQVYEETKGRAKDAVISLINQEREGEQIDRALLNNVLGIYVKLGWDKWSTMKETLKLLCLLILLITMLEKHQIGLRKILVLITCSRYSWLKAFTVIAAAFAEDCLKKEIDRVDHYLHSRSRTKLIERYIPSVYFMLPVVISYVNAAIDTTAIGFKRSKKLQALKIVIKQWTKNAKKSSYKAKISIQSRLSDIDKILDQGGNNEEILSDRSLLLKELNDINSIDSLEAAQKSKLSIRETLVDGEWIVDPLAVKNVFLKYFSTQLSLPVSPRICFVDQFTNRVSLEQQADLEQNVSNEEIKSAVWDYGTNKSSGPDGFTFEFFHR
ncbi:RNA-directed DNA polymerase, eukaryota [Tanacetum coccineum]